MSGVLLSLESRLHEPGENAGSRTWLGPVILIVCGGFAAVAIAYGLGRTGASAAPPLFWGGQILAYFATFIYLARPGTAPYERKTLLVVLAAGQSLLAYAYSPKVYKFPDELQHWRTATDILTTNHLFTPNVTLPVSPEFPGLELVTTFVARTCHIPLFYAGSAVAGLAHILLVCAIYALYVPISQSSRIASTAAFFYMTIPHNFMFNALFVYGALALPFFVRAVTVALGTHRRPMWQTIASGSLCIGICIVTHPLTALVAIAFLFFIGAAAIVTRESTQLVRQVLAIGAIGAAIATLWVGHYAHDATSYLAGPLKTLWNGLSEGGASSGTVSIPASQMNALERVLILASVGVTMILLPLGAAMLWRRRAIAGSRIFAIGAASYYFVIAVRLLDANGAELATRGLTYVAVFASLPLAMAILVFWHSKTRVLAGLAALVVILGCLCSGWPPSWERIPGTVWIDAFESGVDGNQLAMTSWAAKTLGPNKNVACDFSTCSAFGAFAHDFPVGDASAIYYAPAINADVAHDAAVLNIQYLVVDSRMAQQLPITGGYFAVDSLSGKHAQPVDASALAKFDKDPPIDRIFDDGEYQVYDIRGLWNGR